MAKGNLQIDVYRNSPNLHGGEHDSQKRCEWQPCATATTLGRSSCRTRALALERQSNTSKTSRRQDLMDTMNLDCFAWPLRCRAHIANLLFWAELLVAAA
eukprot:6437313-Amphidinium_carterae.1